MFITFLRVLLHRTIHLHVCNGIGPLFYFPRSYIQLKAFRSFPFHFLNVFPFCESTLHAKIFTSAQ